ncbi:MAG: hypothetical protein U0694_23460 [Anaerolineae bacterium]
MPKREKLLNQLNDENDLGVLLAAQMGGVPQELQLIVETAKLDEAVQGLRPQGQYVVRVLGVFEHQASLGAFKTLKFVDDHPLLYQYNYPPVAVFFRGKPQNVHELILDIEQAHASTFGHWRHFVDYLELTQPLNELLLSGGGLLGRMPRPLAERMAKVFEHHKVEHKLIEGEPDKEDEHGRSHAVKLLLIDNSYFVALDFSVEELGKI